MVHISGIALLLGNLVLLELRVFGLGTGLAVKDLACLGLGLALTGFTIAAASGLLMFASQPIELPASPTLPADLAQRVVPAQSAPVDGKTLLAKAVVPTRKDRSWEIELAPLTRLQAWRVAEIKPGAQVSVLGFTFAGEKGDAVLRVEYLFVDGKAYGLRSSPA